MKYSHIIISAIFIFVFDIMFSQDYKKFEKEIIKLDTTLVFENTLTVKSENINCFFEYHDYKEFCYKRIMDYQKNTVDSVFSLIDELINDRIIVIDSYISTRPFEGMTERYIVNAIDSGKIVLLNNDTKLRVSKIIKVKWKSKRKHSRGGRQYFLKGDDKVLIEITDWVN